MIVSLMWGDWWAASLGLLCGLLVWRVFRLFWGMLGVGGCGFCGGGVFVVLFAFFV